MTAARGNPKRLHHPGFRDMTGQLVQGPEGSENVNGNARWRCRHSCGGLVVLEGIRLRSSPPGYCEHCRPKRAGTVVRRAHG